jgi:hypothetical protein
MRKQQGFSFFGLAFLLAIIGSIVSLAIKIVPTYLDFLTFSGATLEAIKQPRIGLQSNDVIRKKIDTQMSINNMHLRDYGDDALTITREDGRMTAEIDYTVVKPVFESESFQIALNLHFNKTHEVPLGRD